MDCDSDLFTTNQCDAVATTDMNVISYYSQDINQLNPYKSLFGYYDRRKVQKIVYELVKRGTLVEEGNKIEDDRSIHMIPLKEHQKRLVWEMRQLENNPYHFTTMGRMGFLCDEVGTGKSLSMLSLIAHNPKPTGGGSRKVPYINLVRQANGSPYLPTIMDLWNSDASFKELNSTLIVVPHSIYSQWKRYIEHDIKLNPFWVATKKNVKTLVEHLNEWIEFPDRAPNVVLCKSTQYNHLIDSIESQDPEYINSLETQAFQCDPNSLDYSITMIPEMIRHIRSTSRQLLSELYSYRRGNQAISNIAEDLSFFQEYMANRKEALERVIEHSDSEIGQIIEYTMVPKSGIVWNRVVFDEADTIPISSSRSVLARMYWCISASSRSFIYPLTSPPPHRTGFIRNLVVNQARCYLYMQHCFFTNTTDAVRRSFPLLPEELATVPCHTPNHIRVAHMSQLSNVIDAVNAGDTVLALRLCQCDTEHSEEGLIESLKRNMREQIEETRNKRDQASQQIASMEDSIRELREALQELGDVAELTSPDSMHHHVQLTQSLRLYLQNKESIEERLVRYTNEEQSLRSRLESMDERLERTMEQDCPICMEPIENGKRAIVKCCNQTFCVDCILQQISSYQDRTTPCPCPMCRATLTTQSFTVLQTERDTERDEPSLPTKEQALRDLMLREDTKRILLFSGHDTTFKKLEPLMKTHKVTYELMNGSDTSIQKKIGRWKEGKTRILCLNSNVLGAGLNLPQATDVVIYHEQLPELETQIIGRAQRPGRDPTRALRVWRFAYETEYRNSQ